MPGPKVTFRLQTKYRVELETREKVQRDSHEFIHQVFYSFILKQKQQVCFLYWHNRLIPRVFLGFPSCMWLQTFLPSCPMVLSVSLCHKHVILYSVSLSFSPQGISSFFRWSCKNSAPAPSPLSQLINEWSVMQVHCGTRLPRRWHVAGAVWRL